jgi:hypothetical protein
MGKKATSPNYTIVEAWGKSGKIGKNYYMYLKRRVEDLSGKKERK